MQGTCINNCILFFNRYTTLRIEEIGKIDDYEIHKE